MHNLRCTHIMGWVAPDTAKFILERTPEIIGAWAVEMSIAIVFTNNTANHVCASI